jgi:hypothetical protein
MKKIQFNTHWMAKAGVVFILTAFLASCDWIDTEYNIDPDAPGDVPMALLLPGIQQAIGFTVLGNDAARPTNIWMQYYDGVARQSYTQGRYQILPADVNNYWGSVYTDAMINAKILLDKAEAEESPHNAGVAKVLMAYTLQVATDLFGDIPYTEALKGTDNVLQPVFDTQQSIYSTIFTLLDEAVSDLGSSEEPVGVSGDVIYDGDPDAWINAARAIKARAELQLSKRNGSSAYSNALALTDAFASNADDMLVPFEGANPNPINQFMVERGDVRMNQTFLDELEATGDPRISFYFGEDNDGEITGSPTGQQDETASPPGSFLASQTSPIVMISYAELKFIEAEAALQTGAGERAVEAYKAAVAASLEQVTGEVDADWMAANIDGETAGTLTLEDILMQKRAALVGQVQPFADWRRTGIPSLTLAPDATQTEIPRRYPYAQDEIIYNPDNIPAVGSVIVPVWWDE